MQPLVPLFAIVAALHLIGSAALIWLVIIPFVRRRHLSRL